MHSPQTTEYFTKATISPNSGVAGLANHQTNAEHATALKLSKYSLIPGEVLIVGGWTGFRKKVCELKKILQTPFLAIFSHF